MSSSSLAVSQSPTLFPARHLTAAALMLVAGSIALAVSAKIQLPFFPVPFTMQTYVVLFIGFAFGMRLAMATVSAYLIQGALGLPVFAQGAGLAYLAGPTGGYLFGFVLAAGLCGWLAERGWDRSIIGTGLAALLGLVVIFALGLTWLGSVVGWDKPVLAWGLLPFVPGEILKLGLLAITMPVAWRIAGTLNTRRQ